MSFQELETKWFDALTSKSLARLQGLLKSQPIILTKESVHCQTPNLRKPTSSNDINDESYLLLDSSTSGRLKDRHITSIQRKVPTPFHSSLTKEATKFLGSSTIAMNALQYALIQLDYDDSSEESLAIWHNIIMFLVSATPTSDINQKYGAAANTSLHVSAFLGEIEVTKALLEKGADVSATNGLGFTPLDVVDRDDQETLEILKKAKPKATSPTRSLSSAGKKKPIELKPDLGVNPLADLDDCEVKSQDKVLSTDAIKLSSSSSSTLKEEEPKKELIGVDVSFEKIVLDDDDLPSWNDFQKGKSDFEKNELTKCELNKSELTKSELTKSEVAKSELTKSELAKRQLTKNDSVKNESAINDLTKKDLKANILTTSPVKSQPTTPSSSTSPPKKIDSFVLKKSVTLSDDSIENVSTPSLIPVEPLALKKKPLKSAMKKTLDQPESKEEISPRKKTVGGDKIQSLKSAFESPTRVKTTEALVSEAEDVKPKVNESPVLESTAFKVVDDDITENNLSLKEKDLTEDTVIVRKQEDLPSINAGILKKAWEMIDESVASNEPVEQLTAAVTETKISLLQEAALLESEPQFSAIVKTQEKESHQDQFLSSAQLYGKWSKSLSGSKIIIGEEDTAVLATDEQVSTNKIDCQFGEPEDQPQPNPIIAMSSNKEPTVIINEKIENNESQFLPKSPIPFLYESFQDFIKDNELILYETIRDKASPSNIRRHQAVYQSIRRQRLLFKYHDLYQLQSDPKEEDVEMTGTLYLKLIRIQHVTLPSKTEAVPIFARVQYQDSNGSNQGNELWCSPTVIAYRDQTELQGETRLRQIPFKKDAGFVNIDFCTTVSKSKLEKPDSFNLLKMFKGNGSNNGVGQAVGDNVSGSVIYPPGAVFDDARSVSSFNTTTTGSTMHSPYYLLTTLETIKIDLSLLSKCRNRVHDIRLPFGLRHVTKSQDEGTGSVRKKSWSGVLHLQAFYLPSNELLNPGRGLDDLEKLDAAVRYIDDKAWFHTLHHEGVLSQKGGDLTFWKRRFFRLVGSFLLAYHETSFEPRFEFDLRSVSLVTPIGRKSLLIKSSSSPIKHSIAKNDRIYQEDEEIAAELPRPFSFRLVSVDGAMMDLCADNREDMVAWMKVLTTLLDEVRNRETYSHLILPSQ